MKSRWRQLCFSLVLFLGFFFVCEALLSILIFQQSSRHSLALVATGKRLIRIGFHRLAPTGIFEDDPILGYRHRRDVVGKHRDLDFSVRYTIDADGNRMIPEPQNPRGRIVFLGGSYTFGHGVEDSETFPAILARDLWPDWRVVNQAVQGYGTAHALLQLEKELEGNSPPKAVIYPFLNGHIIRNYINEEWVSSLSIFGRRHPHFEIERDRPIYKGVITMDEAKPVSAETRAIEQRLTILMLQKMQALCRERGVAFFVVLLPGERWPPSVAVALFQLERPPLDLSQFRMESFSEDGHPNPADHRYFAEQIAKSSINEWVQGLSSESNLPIE